MAVASDKYKYSSLTNCPTCDSQLREFGFVLKPQLISDDNKPIMFKRCLMCKKNLIVKRYESEIMDFLSKVGNIFVYDLTVSSRIPQFVYFDASQDREWHQHKTEWLAFGEGHYVEVNTR